MNKTKLRNKIYSIILIALILFVTPVNAYSPKYDQYISEASRQYGINTNLIKAVIKAESNFNANALSHAGAIGLMQLMPGTARAMNVDPYDPRDNVMGGTKYLNYLYEDKVKQHVHDETKRLPLLLASYNAGPGRVFPACRVPHNGETEIYVKRVVKEFNRLGAGAIKGEKTVLVKDFEPRLGYYVHQLSGSGSNIRRGDPFTIITAAYNASGRASKGKIVISLFDYLEIVSAPGAKIHTHGNMQVAEFYFVGWPEGKKHEAKLEVRPRISGELQYMVRVELEEPGSRLKKVSFPYYDVLDATQYPAEVRNVYVE